MSRANERSGGLFSDDPPADKPRSPRPGPGGRLPLAPADAIAEFAKVVEAFDRADLLAAVEPLKTLRLFGISVRVTLPSRPSGGPRHDRR